MFSVIDTRVGSTRLRLVLEGGPDLGRGPLSERARCLRRWHDHIRPALLADACDTPVVIGAVLCEPHAPGCNLGLIAFDAVGIVRLAGTSWIGLVVALACVGKIGPGRHRFDTPDGGVDVILHEDGSVSVPGGRQGSADGAYFPGVFIRSGFSLHAYRSAERFLRPGQRMAPVQSSARLSAVNRPLHAADFA